MLRFKIAVCLIVLVAASVVVVEGAKLQLSLRHRDQWDVLGLESTDDPDVVMTLLFYEWNLFGVLEQREHFRGNYFGPWSISDDRLRVVRAMPAEGMELRAGMVEDGAELALTITNKSAFDWPELATIIPCLSAANAHLREAPDRGFFDPEHIHTYFLGPGGLELLEQREIHFNEKLIPWLRRYSPDLTFEFSNKWPTSERFAAAGIMIRESEDKEWVAGIAWERFLAAQGHNPVRCMHLSVRVGPLKQGQIRRIRGKMYLFRGGREECLRRFRKEFRIP